MTDDDTAAEVEPGAAEDKTPDERRLAGIEAIKKLRPSMFDPKLTDDEREGVLFAMDELHDLFGIGRDDPELQTVEHPEFPEFVILETDDWQGIYRNGEITWQHHPRFDLDSLLIMKDNLGIKHPTIHYYQEMGQAIAGDNRFPHKLSDVPAELFVNAYVQEYEGNL